MSVCEFMRVSWIACESEILRVFESVWLVCESVWLVCESVFVYMCVSACVYVCECV